ADRRNRAPVALDVEQGRRGRKVVVPQVVVHELPLPLRLPRQRVERHDRVAVQVRALAIAAVIVGGWRPQRREDEAALDVDGEERPDVRARTILPALPFPGLDAGLAGPGHGVERPQQLPAPRVPSADVTVEAGARRLLAVVAAGD